MLDAADRARYAELQVELLDSLLAGGDFPAGFAESKAVAASAGLRDKRRRAVARAWPALALEPGFGDRFDAFARRVGAPAAGEGLADGLAFARACPVGGLGEEARVELLFARAHARGGPFIGGILLHEPRRMLVVVRVGRGRTRPFVLSLRSPV